MTIYRTFSAIQTNGYFDF